MKLAFATCAPGPSWLGTIFAVPSTVAPSTATSVHARIQNARAAASSRSRGSV
jgi:hypothetical protein